MTTYNDTVLESWQFGAALFTTNVIFTNTVANNISLINTVPIPPYKLAITESLTINQTVNLQIFFEMVENLIIDSVSTGSTITADTITELYSILDNSLITFKNTLTENISYTSTLTYLVKQIEIVSNLISLAETNDPKVTFSSSILELITYLETVVSAKAASISEVISLTNAISDLYKVINVITETIVGTDTLSLKYFHIVSLSESLTTSNTLSSSLIGKETLEESFIIKLPEIIGSGTYLAYTYAPESTNVTTYTNYNFDGSALFNYKYLFYNSTGLYEYGGARDDGSVVRSYIQTAGLSFGTSNLKQVPSLYLGYTSDNLVLLRAHVDGKGTFHYKLNKYTNGLDTKKIDLGKGLLGRYFQFELITDADEFEMESIEFMPVVLQRKI